MNTSRSEKWNIIKSPWFYSVLILFIIHQILQRGLLIHMSFADNYLDPSLFLPIVLGAYLQERRLILKNNNHILDNFRVIGLSIILCVLVEFVFPYFNCGYTFDVYDFVAYGAGSVYFHFTINKSSMQEGLIIHELH
ncbi:MAG: hypothetical protein IPI60_09375 [Saprospiraceae bacterium]|nr:hypothetical protein [Saprospiraceae bacterium]